MNNKSNVPKEYDIWRDSPLRYAGYCNEVGEAFAPIYPRFLIPSYTISIGYVLADTTSKSLQEYHRQEMVSDLLSVKSVIYHYNDIFLVL